MTESVSPLAGSPTASAPTPAATAGASPNALPKPAPPRRSHAVAQPMTGATSLVRALEAIGVETVFGIPGGAILPAYEPLLASEQIRHILVRHEQGAGHAAEGYALASGRVGVCLASSGPGATNLVTPIADAYMDSVPIVAITGQVPSASIGSDSFQEVDIRGITMPITKHSYLVTDPDEIAHTLAEAFHIAGTGRPGPVLVDIAVDALTAMTTFRWPQPLDLPGYRPTLMPHGRQVREAAKLITDAQRPVLLIGGGVLKAGATAELYELAKLTGIPVVTTMMARGAYPDSDPQHLGLAGMHGSVPAVAALQQADLLIALGTRLDDRVTGELAAFAPQATVVHADIDPAEISKNRHADVPIVGDCRRVIGALIAAIREEQSAATTTDREPWWAMLNKLRDTYPLGYDARPDGALAPQLAIKRLGELIGPEAIYVSGVGQHQVWAAQYLGFERPGTWLNSGGLGTMGFAVPAAMGAKLGRPGATVWAIDGDGCFQMTSQELTTCALEGIPIKVAVINNDDLGMINRSAPAPKAAKGASRGKEVRRIPDFVRLADAYGCVGLRCDRAEDLDKTIEAAMAVDDRPVVVDFVVGRDAMTWPMVSSAASDEDLQAARAMAPGWDRKGE